MIHTLKKKKRPLGCIDYSWPAEGYTKVWEGKVGPRLLGTQGAKAIGLDPLLRVTSPLPPQISISYTECCHLPPLVYLSYCPSLHPIKTLMWEWHTYLSLKDPIKIYNKKLHI